jgi:hypothetical protein
VLTPLPDVLKNLPWCPSNCTAEVIASVRQVHPAILSTKYFADLIGVGTRTIDNWLAWGRDEIARIESGEEPNPQKMAYVHFYREMRKAKALTVCHVQAKALAGEDGWQGGFRVLEQMDGARFARRQTIKLEPPKPPPEPTTVAGPIVTAGQDTYDTTTMTADALHALIKRLAQP